MKIKQSWIARNSVSQNLRQIEQIASRLIYKHEKSLEPLRLHASWISSDKYTKTIKIETNKQGKYETEQAEYLDQRMKEQNKVIRSNSMQVYGLFLEYHFAHHTQPKVTRLLVHYVRSTTFMC